MCGLLPLLALQTGAAPPRADGDVITQERTVSVVLISRLFFVMTSPSAQLTQNRRRCQVSSHNWKGLPTCKICGRANCVH